MAKWFSDDKQFITDLLKEEWSLGTGEEPKWYCKPTAQLRDNRIGSIYVYDSSGHTNEKIVGINYDGYRRTHRISIDIENPLEERNIRWVEEVYRILMKYRRAGLLRKKGYQWDYIQIGNDQYKPNYFGFFQTVLEITLIREFQAIEQSGFVQDKKCDKVAE